jgi:hypothetical protein
VGELREPGGGSTGGAGGLGGHKDREPGTPSVLI